MVVLVCHKKGIKDRSNRSEKQIGHTVSICTAERPKLHRAHRATPVVVFTRLPR